MCVYVIARRQRKRSVNRRAFACETFARGCVPARHPETPRRAAGGCVCLCLRAWGRRDDTAFASAPLALPSPPATHRTKPLLFRLAAHVLAARVQPTQLTNTHRRCPLTTPSPPSTPPRPSPSHPPSCPRRTRRRRPPPASSPTTKSTASSRTSRLSSARRPTPSRTTPTTFSSSRYAARVYTLSVAHLPQNKLRSLEQAFVAERAARTAAEQAAKAEYESA